MYAIRSYYVLFTDACHTDLTVLRNIEQLPARLLSVGMLLTRNNFV